MLGADFDENKDQPKVGLSKSIQCSPIMTDPPRANTPLHNCRSPDFKSPIGPTKNLERHYNQVVGWSVGCSSQRWS